jgi:hypothetical protein
MRRWPDNDQLQFFACTAIDRLASSKENEGENLKLKRKIIDVGGLVALAEARTKHQNDARVWIPSASALVTLAQTK